ncbi:MAG: c-type cytochrome [Acidobacteriia bacterium]|nr:c-type cytochrome [Terriglobia bacterium]
MTRRRLILILLLVLLAAAAWTARQILHHGLSARATPTRLETALARNVRHLAFPANARTLANPVPVSPEAMREGLLHFADHCAACHANDGSGDTPYGQGLYPKPPDLRSAATQNLSDGELFWIIENGVRFTGMPAFSEPGEQQESWQLVRFLRHLPQLTPAERAEMERNNPKTAEDRAEEQEEEDFLKGASPSPEMEMHHH